MMLADIAIAVLLAVLLSDVMFPGDQSMSSVSLPQPVRPGPVGEYLGVDPVGPRGVSAAGSLVDRQ